MSSTDSENELAKLSPRSDRTGAPLSSMDGHVAEPAGSEVGPTRRSDLTRDPDSM